MSTRPTVKLDITDLARGEASLPLVLMALERYRPWGIYALKLGTLALLQECTRAMALPNSNPELIVKARELVEVLAHLPSDDSASLRDRDGAGDQTSSESNDQRPATNDANQVPAKGSIEAS